MMLYVYELSLASDKPWMTSFIKRKIKARQRAFSSGDVIKYKELCDKIKTLIKKAKKEYYHSKVGSQRNYNPARCYKDILQLAGIETTSTTTTSTAELLQGIFTKPWQDLHAASIPSLAEVAPLLKENPPPVPSIGQDTVNRNRMVRLAGPRDKYVIVHFYFWSRDDERGCHVRESYFT